MSLVFGLFIVPVKPTYLSKQEDLIFFIFHPNTISEIVYIRSLEKGFESMLAIDARVLSGNRTRLSAIRSSRNATEESK
jgi:hypothetical protein